MSYFYLKTLFLNNNMQRPLIIPNASSQVYVAHSIGEDGGVGMVGGGPPTNICKPQTT